ncbi:MAG: Na/Pi symporter [Flavobacteriales bacterium]|nr:Na/Pi symporter [Flavobacteriales bacterium]
MNANDFWEFLAGLGIFMFGMFLLEESIRNLSGRAFKGFIRRYTEGTLKAVLTGTFATAILQSSSAVTLMVLAFTGAGIMSLQNGIGVVLGSNLGTTVTSWIVAGLGFKVSIEALALPFIGIGGLGLIFLGKSLKGSNISKLSVGFGFLFMGLDYMKRSIEAIATDELLSMIPDYGPLIYILVGFVLTAALQSSSASIAVILSALHSGLFSYTEATAMVIGANLGTTVTVMIGAVGGSTVKKRVGMSHFLFNFITAIVATMLLPLLNRLVFDVMGLGKDPVMGLAMFHTIFNLMGVLLFIPFLPLFSKLLVWAVPEKRMETSVFISKVTPDVPEAAMVSLQQETQALLQAAMEHNLDLLSIDPKLVFTGNVNGSKGERKKPEEQYARLKAVQAEIYAFAALVQGQEMSEQEASLLNRLLSAVRYAISSAKTLKDVKRDIDEMEDSESPHLNDCYADLRRKMMENYIHLQRVMSEEEDLQNLPRLVKTMKSIMAEDAQLMQELMKGLKQHHIPAELVSVLLAANRAFTLAARQMLLAVKDFKLSAHDAALFDNLEVEVKA